MSVSNHPNICNCANPECLENGCILRRRYTPSAPPPFWTGPAPSITPPTLTEDDIRRIVREEIQRGLAQPSERREG
jgi:hypothetical protein